MHFNRLELDNRIYVVNSESCDRNTVKCSDGANSKWKSYDILSLIIKASIIALEWCTRPV